MIAAEAANQRGCISCPSIRLEATVLVSISILVGKAVVFKYSPITQYLILDILITFRFFRILSYVFVCVRVCTEREEERGKEREGLGLGTKFYPH